MSDPDSPSNHDPSSPPRQALLPSTADPKTDPVAATSKSSRRLPPPCWSLEETTALIDAYGDKRRDLGRGSLKADHWEDVAEAVAAACPGVTPRKTAVQCRHKMEKLRQRYRAEIQRARSVPVARFVSSWVHYKRMEATENDDGGGPTPRFFNRNGGGGGGIRIRIPTGVSVAGSGKYKASLSSGVSTNPRPGRVGADDERGSEMMMSCGDDPIASAIKLLGDGMLRTEEKKMEMVREIEAMRMEMEMKRTKMILESQQRIVETFAKTMSEMRKKKATRVSSSME